MHFQLPHSDLFPGGTRLFIYADFGVERLILETGKQVTLELADLPIHTATPVVQQVPMSSGGPDAVSISPLTGGGTKRTFTVKGVNPGQVALMAAGTHPLFITVGHFVNDPFFDIDLIANVFRESDAAKMHVLTRTLFSNPDNLFNEGSDFNLAKFAPSLLPCGSVSKVGASRIFHPVDYDYKPYSKPVPHMETADARSHLQRTDVKYDEHRLKRGCNAIKKRLENGIPSLVGLVYIPSQAVQANGTFNETGDGGHTVPIVGCNAHATQFLYIDVYPEGSKLKYNGGHLGQDFFPGECHFLGMFELKDDAARGSFVLRAKVGTAASDVFSGDQFLEVVSGPL